MASERRPVVDRLADMVFYGPLGFVLDHRTLIPQLAKRGRRQVAFTKTIGRFTVHQGQQRLSGVMDGLVSRAPGTAALATGEQAVATAMAPDADTPDAHVDDGEALVAERLAIPQYDTLSAIQVVPRLEMLADDELAEISDYEAATRSRRTILAKINQLRQ